MEHILIIDDDRSLLGLLQNCMQGIYEADTAWNGKQGLAMLSQAKYDLVLLDVMLPGENGFDVLEKIRKQYAVPVIMGEIRRFLRDDGMIRVSRSIKENARQLGRIREGFWQSMGREPTLSELERESGLTMDEVITALDAGCEVESIYRTVHGSDGSEVLLVDMLGRDGESEEIVDRLLLEKLLGELDERERKLIRLRYFENRTQMQVAGDLGMSQVQVSRLEKKVLLRMRQVAAV